MIREFFKERIDRETVDLKWVPCMITMCNLSCGIFALLAIIKKEFQLAPFFVLLAGLFDVLDGRVARSLDVVSDLGKELDSLSDIISFGIAPTILVWNVALLDLGGLGLLLVLLFPIAGALRLARYNISDFEGAYVGVPITVAGSILAFISFFALKYLIPIEIWIVLIILLSYLMISKVKIPKL
ncbi:CDP-diacylglycerol--serine O-phosphatidyltransferase [Orenia marismortui]|uniref:CDP-diacylglycerol--serine O-phosphatidyltransferase n=1 Tax=Orenia marismortui TaxID=46469 RepID=A0A4R8H175_9FIRM|nr:CDP-diacylglycerol--serine O-phosphatidyltransferase [Orenia marismortui]TDX53257.1 CDP-diacylglycerol--serine O-phosphatidyltransferase [Orenia marismortui]